MSSRPSPTRVSFASVTANNLGASVAPWSPRTLTAGIGTVRKLNSVLFPIKYSDKFYSDIVQPEVEDFCQLSACDHSLRVLSPPNPLPSILQ